MVDPYAVVRRLTGHELISPKDARLLTEAVDGLIGEIGSKDARIAELEAEVERLTKEAESYRDIAARKSNQVADMIHPKALSRTGAVKPLEWVASDDWEYRWTADLYAIEDQGKNWPKDRYWLYYNGQRLGKFGTLDTALFTAQADYERRILSALTADKPEQVPSEDMICAAQAQISEGIGAYLRKFADSIEAKRARDYLHKMPESEWVGMTRLLAEESVSAALRADPTAGGGE